MVSTFESLPIQSAASRSMMARYPMLSSMNVRTMGRPLKSPIRQKRIKGVGSTFRTPRLKRNHRMAIRFREVSADSHSIAMERSSGMIGSLRRQIETAAAALRPGIRSLRAKNRDNLLLLVIAFKWILLLETCIRRATHGPSLVEAMEVALSRLLMIYAMICSPVFLSRKIRPTVPCVVSLRLQSIGITHQVCCTTRRAAWTTSFSSLPTRKVGMARTNGRTKKAWRASRHSCTTPTPRAST